MYVVVCNQIRRSYNLPVTNEIYFCPKRLLENHTLEEQDLLWSSFIYFLDQIRQFNKEIVQSYKNLNLKHEGNKLQKWMHLGVFLLLLLLTAILIILILLLLLKLRVI